MSSDAVKGINWRCNTMPRRLCESSQTPRRILEAGSLREAIYSKQYSFGGFNQVSAVACCRRAGRFLANSISCSIFARVRRAEQPKLWDTDC